METESPGQRRQKLRPKRPPLNWLLLPNTLAYLISWYGLFVGKFPVQTLSVALGLGFVFSAGFYRIRPQEVKGEDYLPTNSPSMTERTNVLLFDAIDDDRPSKFPTVLFLAKTPKKLSNSSNETTTSRMLTRQKRQRDTFVSASSFAESCRQNQILLVAKANASGQRYNLFSKAMFKEIERFEDLILNISVSMTRPSGEHVDFRYEKGGTDYDDSLCTKQQTGECAGFSLRILRGFFDGGVDPATLSDDPFDMLFSGLPGIGLTYPKFFFNDFSKYLAEVETDSKGYVQSIGAVREIYCINEFFFDSFKTSNEVWLLWEAAFNNLLKNGGFFSAYFDVYWMAEYQRGGEQNSLITEMVPKVAATFVALMLWCCVGALATDALGSKPWCGVIGVFATLFACSSGFGICLWTNPNFNPILMAVPLLVLAIGLDDMFIALEAWSRSDPRLPVEERMMTTMNIGGTTICLTFLINLIDFVVGNYTPFPIINQLSIYAIAAMVFDFVFQITIFAPCLAIFGYVEQSQRHACCCCLKVEQRNSVTLRNNSLNLICCTNELPGQPKETSFAVRKLTDFLTSIPVRIISVLVFFAYAAVCGWSISSLQIGLKPERVYRQSSNTYSYTLQNRLLFSEYADSVKIVVNNEVDYSQPKTRKRINDFIDKVHRTGYFWPNETKCWVCDFDRWATSWQFNLSSNKDVLWQLQRFPDGFFSSVNPTTFESYRPYLSDVRIDLNGTTILKSRVHMRAKNMTSPARQLGMITSLRQIIETYRPSIDMYAFGDNFLLYDNYLTAIPTTLYYCGMTLGATIVIAIFLIPHPACLFWVTIFVTSVLVGIVGMMPFWDMDLDSITLINLLVAISFSSDLIAHPIYVFLVSPVPNAATMAPAKVRLIKTRALIEEVATAALPACTGTTLSVMAMSTSDAYIFATFFRMMFLSSVLSILHALIFVPTFMSFFGPSNPGITRPGERKSSYNDEEDSSSAESNGAHHSSPLSSNRPSYKIRSNVVVEEDVQSFTAFIPAEPVRRRLTVGNRPTIVVSSDAQLTLHHDVNCKGCDMCAYF